MLLGRAAERQAIERLLAGARVGDGGALVITGDPGIGKSALLDAVRSTTAGMLVITVRGAEAEHEVPFAGLHQLCAPLSGLIPDLAAPQADALGVALALRDGPAPGRFAVGAALLGLLTRAAEDTPLAVVIDDAQHLDESSASAIAFVARRLSSDPVAILVAERTGSPSVLTGLTRLELGPLEATAARELLTADAGRPLDDEEFSRLHRATAGNPLALLELGNRRIEFAAAPPGSPIPLTGELLTAFSVRQRSLSDDARAALLLASISGDDVDVLMRACTAQGVPFAALEEAEAAGLVRLQPGEVGFRHPLVRAAVYADSVPTARRAAHRILADVLGSSQPDRRAWHRAEAAIGPDEATAALLDGVAAVSAARGAYAVAAAQYERAADLTVARDEKAERMLHAGEQSWLAGDRDRSRTLLGRALEAAPTSDARARALIRLGTVEARCGSLAAARDLQFEAYAEARGHDTDLAVSALADAVESCLFLADAESALRAGEMLVEHAASGSLDGIPYYAAGVAEILGGSADRGANLIRTGLARATPSATSSPASSAVEEQWGLSWSLTAPLFLRESGAARDRITEAARVARTHAAVGVLPFLLTLLAKDDAAATNWHRADEGYAEAVRLARESGHDTDLALALGGWAWLGARRGDSDSAREHAREAGELASAHDANLAGIWASWAIADLASVEGRASEATTSYEALQDRLRELSLGDVDLAPVPELIEHLKPAAGAGERLESLARSYLEAARRKALPWALARSHRAMAIVADDEQEAERWFGTALELHEGTPDVYEAARTFLALGSRRRRARRRAASRDPLRAALERFDRLGATPWADRAAAELAATGETAVRREAGSLATLTPQERQIGALLADGLTTREAAASLFLSPKTVEYHLRHVYLKLGIRSRDELRQVLEH
ncbi:ATP-binding protein [Leifsonia flava]|uniref:Helix-turn-helix transcriptional regulator n=1 Tax=Orlajensenia leifsoniae TaxID=2561933 RepID=A0A4Y9R5I1_9MICO|nr:LuxR family transcriptional regulator [Leifsonia flava]TFV99839.1 helix-turn-helix transcriptional regulator [Leifsonia flava]